jgi:hypothetical protein
MKIQPSQAQPILVQNTNSQTQPEPTETQLTAQAQDNFNPAQSQQMLEALQNQPEIRPEVLARAKQLAADPNYPPSDVIANVANLFVNDTSTN